MTVRRRVPRNGLKDIGKIYEERAERYSGVNLKAVKDEQVFRK